MPGPRRVARLADRELRQTSTIDTTGFGGWQLHRERDHHRSEVEEEQLGELLDELHGQAVHIRRQ